MRWCCCQKPFLQAGVLASRPRSLLQFHQAWPGRKTSSVALLPPTCSTQRQARALSGTCGRCRTSPLRAVATEPPAPLGYDRSAEYVAERLKEAGYLVHFEEFEFPFFEERVPPVLLVRFPDGRQEPAPAAALRTLTNSGSSNVTARLRAVSVGFAEGPPLASASGCKTTDFDEFEHGSVALIRRGTCTFQTKVENAWAAGAAGWQTHRCARGSSWNVRHQQPIRSWKCRIRP